MTIWDQKIQSTREELNTATAAVMQRLKWAVGANPNLTELLNEFTSASNARRDKMDEERLYSSICMKFATSIWSMEIQRLKTPEGLEKDKELMAIISSYEQVSSVLYQYSSLVTPIEEAIVELLDPQGAIDQTWIKNVEALIENMSKQLLVEKREREQVATGLQDKMYEHAHSIRNLMGHHQRLGSDIRTLLRSFVRMNFFKQKNIQNYIIKHKEFIDTISELCTNILSKDFTEKILKASNHQIESLLKNIDFVFDGLFSINYENVDAEPASPEDDKVSSNMISSYAHQKSKYCLQLIRCPYTSSTLSLRFMEFTYRVHFFPRTLRLRSDSKVHAHSFSMLLSTKVIFLEFSSLFV